MTQRSQRSVASRCGLLLLLLATWVAAAMAGPVPDLRIKNNGQSTYPTNDYATQTVASGADAVYLVAIHNVGTSAGSFSIRAAASPSSWNVRYYYHGTPISTAITSSTGWTTGSVSAGRSLAYPIEVRVASPTGVGGTNTVTMIGRYGSSGPNDDVYAVTNAVLQSAAPVARDDYATTTRNTSVWVNLLANDSDPNGLPLSIGWLSTPLAVQGGSVLFVPPTNATGTFAFTYKAKNSNGVLSNTATVRVSVTGPPPGPTGVSLSVTPTHAYLSTTLNFHAAPFPAGTYNVVYQFEVRRAGSSNWSVIRGYTTTPYYSTRPGGTGTWETRALMRDQNTGHVYSSNIVTIYVR